MIASISLSLSRSLSVLSRPCLFLSGFSFSFSFHVRTRLHVHLPPATYALYSFSCLPLFAPVCLLSPSYSPCFGAPFSGERCTTYNLHFIPFRCGSHHAFNIVRPTLIGQSEIVGICHWTRKSNGGRPLSLSLLDVSPFLPTLVHHAVFLIPRAVISVAESFHGSTTETGIARRTLPIASHHERFR